MWKLADFSFFFFLFLHFYSWFFIHLMGRNYWVFKKNIYYPFIYQIRLIPMISIISNYSVYVLSYSISNVPQYLSTSVVSEWFYPLGSSMCSKQLEETKKLVSINFTSEKKYYTCVHVLTHKLKMYFKTNFVSLSVYQPHPHHLR